uniref:Zinc finger E-box binding homeobox 1 n=1 Tax=Rousettus aegyptiacus TaxID=9407 RepID=A0A7J8EBW4_ROUAE|nr:zinc finger E-box binding homeobox 1 [Rousettus aegyptiacus]
MMTATQMQKMNKTMILMLKSSYSNKTLLSFTPRHRKRTRGRAHQKPVGMMKMEHQMHFPSCSPAHIVIEAINALPL